MTNFYYHIIKLYVNQTYNNILNNIILLQNLLTHLSSEAWLSHSVLSVMVSDTSGTTFSMESWINSFTCSQNLGSSHEST